MKNILLSLVLFVISGFVQAVSAQTPEGPVKLSLASGDVVSIDSTKIVLQTKDGPIDVILSDKAEFKKVTPENPTLKGAVAAAFSDIGVGDKLVVTGLFSADKKTLPARTVYLMTKSDISQKQAKETEQWRTRGIAGRVVSVNPQTNQIALEVRGLMNSSNVSLTLKEKAKFRRYAPGSVKFSEAKESSVGEIKPGDQLRALGDKSADGTSFAAEEIVTGAFQTIGGTVKTVDPAKNEVVITDFQTKKDTTILISSSSLLKKFPEEMAQRMASFQSGQGGAQPPQGGAQPPQGGQQGQGAGPGGRGGFGGQRPGGVGGIDEMLERFPTITAGDLKPGEMIAVLSTKNGNADRITAIKLLAGVEPFLRIAQANGAGQGRRQTGQSLNIPGLDGIDFP